MRYKMTSTEAFLKSSCALAEGGGHGIRDELHTMRWVHHPRSSFRDIGVSTVGWEEPVLD